MAAPKGNQFWKLRSKHGRDKLFQTPQLLQEAAEEYFQWCDDNPLYETDFRGKDATEVEVPKMRPYTIQGLCRYLNCNTMWFNEFERSIKNVEAEKRTKEHKDFSLILQDIRDVIFNQKYTGAASGFLNANLIIRDLGIADKQQLSNDPDNPFEAGQQIVVFKLPENNR